MFLLFIILGLLAYLDHLIYLGTALIGIGIFLAIVWKP